MPSGVHIRYLFVLFISATVAVFTGLFISQQAELGVIFLATVGGLAFFFFSSYRWWWTIIPALFASGGILYFGFKIYLYEVGLFLCIVPLMFVGALNWNAIRQSRGPLPKVFYILFIFLFGHMFWSLAAAKLYGEGGLGNILRHYMGGFWALLFVFLFHFFGSTQYLRRALFLLFVAYLVRAGLTVFTYFIPSFNYIPGINLVLPGSTMAQIDDLRWSAPGLASVSLIYLCMARSGWTKFLHVLIIAAAFCGLLLGGGRVAAVVFVALPLAAAYFQRKYSILIAFATILFSGLAYLNVNPRAIEEMEPRMQRTLGIFILERGAVATHSETQASDEWHERLRRVALERWTSTPISMFVGNRIKKFDYSTYLLTGLPSIDFESMIGQASDLGAYESGWYTVLATTGIIGFILFGWMIFTFLRESYSRLRQTGIRDYRTGFCFLAFFNIMVWFVLGWTIGGYPSYELVLGAIAFGAFREIKTKPLPKSSAPHAVEPHAAANAVC